MSSPDKRLMTDQRNDFTHIQLSKPVSFFGLLVGGWVKAYLQAHGCLRIAPPMSSLSQHQSGLRKDARLAGSSSVRVPGRLPLLT